MERRWKIKNSTKDTINISKISDWKFWSKVLLGSLPLMSVIIFTSFNLWQAITSNDHNSVSFIPEERISRYAPNYIEEIASWSIFMRMIYVLSRNFFILTTIVNLMFSIFWINTAINHKYEGQGKLDNDQIGLIVMVSMSYIIISYNISLFVTRDTSLMIWVNYMSWLLEHSIIGGLGIAFFIIFYNKERFLFKKKYVLTNWGYCLAVIMGYLLLWTIIGYINKYTISFAMFGNMSYHGEFPYDYLEFDNPNIVYVNVDPLTQYFIFFVLNSLSITGYYFLYASQVNFYMKRNHIWKHKKNICLKYSCNLRDRI